MGDFYGNGTYGVNGRALAMAFWYPPNCLLLVSPAGGWCLHHLHSSPCLVASTDLITQGGKYCRPHCTAVRVAHVVLAHFLLWQSDYNPQKPFYRPVEDHQPTLYIKVTYPFLVIFFFLCWGGAGEVIPLDLPSSSLKPLGPITDSRLCLP